MKSDLYLAELLAETGLPVNRIAARYENKKNIPEKYLIYGILSGLPIYYDDDLAGLTFQYTIILFAKSDYRDILSDLIQILNNEEIRIITIGQEMYNPDIDFHEITITVQLFESMGEE